MGDFAENWCSLLELFISSAGLKLRLPILDTVLMRNGRVIGHFWTNNDGVVCKYSPHEVTRQSVYQRIAHQHVLDTRLNPFGYIAVAHFPSGVSRLLKRAEFQEVMNQVSGPYEFGDQAPAQQELPFCIQNYIPPIKDARYLALYDLQEGQQCTVLARRFSSRYSHPFDDPGTLLQQQADREDELGLGLGGLGSVGAGLGSCSTMDPDNRGVLSAEEMLVESQLVAMGLLEPRGVQGSGAQANGGGGGGEGGDGGGARGEGSGEDGGEMPEATSPSAGSIPAPRRSKADVARLLQTLCSFVERAHGQRILGLVAEFIPGAGDSLTLMAVHGVQLDKKSSRGRLGTFTERWRDYLDGLAPAPAPQPPAPSRRNQPPSLLRSADNSLVMSERAGTGGSAGAGNGSLLRVSGGFTSPSPISSSMPASPMLQGAPSSAAFSALSAASPRQRQSLSATYGPGTAGAAGPAGAGPTRIFSGKMAATAASANDSFGRPGSAPASVIKANPASALQRSGGGLPYNYSNSTHSSPANGQYTLRNAVSASRPGGGGNPTASPMAPDSYALWLMQEAGPQASVSAKLALEVEALRERLQRQTDVAARAEAALQQLAVSSGRETSELRLQVEALRLEVGRLADGKRQVEAEYERLRAERLGIQSHRTELSDEVERLREQLAGERETLSNAVRQASSREESLDSQLRGAREERDDALAAMGALRRRLEEEQEVVEALRNQLFDYKQLTIQLQSQVRRGRNNKPLVQSAVGMPSILPASMALQGTSATGTATARSVKEDEADADDGASDIAPAQTGSMAGMQGAGDGGAAGSLTGKGPGPAMQQGLGAHKPLVPAGGGRVPRGFSTSSTGNGGSGARSRTSHSPSLERNATLLERNVTMLDRSLTYNGRDTSPGGSLSPGFDGRLFSAGADPSGDPRVVFDPAASAAANSFGPMLAEIRRRERGYGSLQAPGVGPPGMGGALERPDSGNDLPMMGRMRAPGSPAAGGGPQGAAAGPAPAAAVGGPRKGPNYESISLVDLFLLSYAKEPPTQRMQDYMVKVVSLVAGHEQALYNIFSFYCQLGKVLWLDNKLTMSEKQFSKLAGELGILDIMLDDVKEIFKKMSDKTEFSSEAAANHPHSYIHFDQFPEAIIRLAALRYEWRPPENLEDAEEEIYFAAAPFMPPASRSSHSGTDNVPSRPPEQAFLDIVTTFMSDDVLIKARRFKTAGSVVAKSKSQGRTAPVGLWI